MSEQLPQADPALILRVYAGPGEHAPFPAVMAQFRPPPAPAQTAEQLGAALAKFLTPALMARLALPLRDAAFETLVAALANALQDCFGANDFESRVEREPDGRARVMIGYADAGAATLALQTALAVAAAFFGQLAGHPADAASLTARLQDTARQMALRQPDPLARALQRAARARGIPVYAVAPGSRVWLFGQGSAGLQHFEAASHLDSLTGMGLGRNKVHSNQLVRALGFPGVQHGIADSLRAARRIAREFGFPVVVKPVASGKGRGVTTGVADDVALQAAYAAALETGRGEVLVERPVAGDDHRLVVIGHRLAWAVRRSPPRLTGDGRHTVAELLELENRRRAALPAADIAAVPLVMDAEVQGLLAEQGLAPGACPAAGASVLLRRIASISRGGTLADCTAALHPDNRDMAEAIARAFHLDAIGIDFMTPDIGRSWREVACAVLEVNSTPGFSSDARAVTLLEARFPSGGRGGRIPTVVLVGAGGAALEAVAALLRQRGLRVGRADGRQSFLDDAPRHGQSAALPERVRGLLLDAGCDALVIGTSAAEISQHGLPLDRCDLALVADAATLSPALARLVTSCAMRVLPLAAAGGWPGQALETELADLVHPGGRDMKEAL
jgi:cyanophycin synthetase